MKRKMFYVYKYYIHLYLVVEEVIWGITTIQGQNKPINGFR